MNKLVDQLEDIRKGRGLSQEALAHTIGVTTTHYNRICRGKQALTLRFVRRAVKVFPELGGLFLSEIIDHPIDELAETQAVAQAVADGR